MGHVSLGLGLDLDRVFVCGLAEGTFPARVRDDSLLPDADRRATDGGLALRAEPCRRRPPPPARRARGARAGRACCSTPGAISAAPPIACRHASCSTRWRRSPAPATTPTTCSQLDVDWFRQVPSFAAGIARVPFPATEQEHRLRALLDYTRQGGRHRHVGAPRRRPRARAWSRLRACRVRAPRSPASTATSAASPYRARPVLDAVVSPTRLERWARLPLRLPDGARPPRGDRGAAGGGLRAVGPRPRLARAQHARRVPARGPRAARWSSGTRRDLDRGRSGAPPRDRRRAVRPVRGARGSPAAAPSGTATAAGSSPTSTGSSPTTPNCAPTTDYTTARHRARVRPPRGRVAGDRDRRCPTVVGCGSAVPPTGSTAPPPGSSSSSTTRPGRPFGVGDEGDPTSAGTRLQLPVYALAARSAFGNEHTPVTAAYWFVSTRGQFRWAEVALDEATRARFDEVLRVIVDGIEHGVFPCRLDPPDSWARTWRSYADPDARGTRDRYRDWVRKRGAPELAAYVALSEPDGDDDDRCRRARGGRRNPGGARMTVVQPELGFVRRRRRRRRASRSSTTSATRCSSRRAPVPGRRSPSSIG